MHLTAASDQCRLTRMHEYWSFFERNDMIWIRESLSRYAICDRILFKSSGNLNSRQTSLHLNVWNKSINKQFFYKDQLPWFLRSFLIFREKIKWAIFIAKPLPKHSKFWRQILKLVWQKKKLPKDFFITDQMVEIEFIKRTSSRSSYAPLAFDFGAIPRSTCANFIGCCCYQFRFGLFGGWRLGYSLCWTDCYFAYSDCECYSGRSSRNKCRKSYRSKIYFDSFRPSRNILLTNAM